MNNIISIIIPVYNSEKYIEDCIKSIINQNYQNIEVIFIDDGSIDLSISIIKKYIEKYKNFRIIYQKHLGAGVARNAGIHQAIGDYIIFLDSDDFINNNALEKIIYNIESNKSDICICYSDILIKNKKKKHIIDIDKNIFTYFDYKDNFFQLFNGWCWNKIYRKDFIIKNHCLFQDIKKSEDNLFTYNCLISAKKISLFRESFICHRIHKDSLEKNNILLQDSFIQSIIYIYNLIIYKNVYMYLEKSFINMMCDKIAYNINNIDDNNIKYIKKRCMSLLHSFKIYKLKCNYFYHKETYNIIYDIFNNNIDLSVLVTFCNQKKYVTDCLLSILTQKTKYKIEVLICVDGKDDGSIALIKEISKKYDNIFFWHVFSDDKLLNLSRASRNRLFLLDYARGKYFICLDGDDYFSSNNRFNDGILYLENNNNVICHACTYNVVNDDGKIIWPCRVKSEIFNLNKYIDKKIYIHVSCCIFRNIFKKYKYKYKNFFNDTTLVLYMLSYGDMYCSGKKMFSYRKSNVSTFSRLNIIDKKILSLSAELDKIKISKYNIKIILKAEKITKEIMVVEEKISNKICSSILYQNINHSIDVINFKNNKSIIIRIYYKIKINIRLFFYKSISILQKYIPT